MRGDTSVLEVLAHAERLCINSVVLGELLGGFAAGTRESKNRAELARFLDSPRVEVLHITAQTADSYALIYLGLRRKGQPIPTNDLWIAASALEHGAALLTHDAHFAQIDGLRMGRELDDFLP
jgi:tRNA(fMet)-specific endonuclease VapC